MRDRTTSLCPITRSPVARAKADATTAQIQANFPKGLAQPALRALAGAGFTTLADLTKVKKQSLAELHGMGPKGLALLAAALKHQGKSFAK